MTSGNFKTRALDEIVIPRDERQRRELTGIDELAESINRLGLIHPPVITPEGVLVAGERRMAAMRSLGWTHTMVQLTTDLDPLTNHLIELDENIRRMDISWQERATAIDNYHKIRISQEGANLSQQDIATELGLSRVDVTRNIAVAEAMNSGNKLVADADKFSTALNIIERENSRKASTAMAKLDDMVNIATLSEGEEYVSSPSRNVPLLNEDFHDWAAGYCDRPFNLIHCDFPYGVGMHNSDQGAGQSYGTYRDDKDVYWRLLDTLKMAMSNVVAESAHLVFWFSMDYYHETALRLTDMGWKVNPFPLIWMKSDNTGIIPDAQRGPRRIYETALFASRGDRKLTAKGAVANAFAHPGRDKSIHMNEKPVPMLRHFLSMVCDEYSHVLDPTAGSANALKAATELGASHVLGLERDYDFYTRSRDAYYEWADAAE